MDLKGFFASIAVVMVATSSQAATKKTFDIDVRYSFDGLPESKLGFIAQENKKSSLTNIKENEEFKIDVTASDGEFEDFKGIILDLNLAYAHNGGKIVESDPIVLAENGEETLVTFTDDKGQEKTLKVKATRR